MYQLEVSLCHALNSNNLLLRYPAGSIFFFSDLKEIKTVGKKRKRSQKKQNEVKTKSKNENTRQISSKYLLNLLKHKLNLNTNFFSDFYISIYAVTFITYELLSSLLIVK